MIVRASAPGKLIMLGEYAVLEGAPAVVMATDRRAQVTLENTQAKQYSVDVPHFGIESAQFNFDEQGNLKWLNVGERVIHQFKLVTKILGSVVTDDAVKIKDLPIFKASLSTLEFFQETVTGSNKLGLGSSAALTVALYAAVTELVGVSARRMGLDQWLMRLMDAHASFQPTRGSGIDVAASLYGGVLSYQRHRGRKPEVHQLEWPGDIQLVCVWTGRSTSTQHYLEQLSAWRKANPKLAKRLFNELKTLSKHGLSELKTGSSSGFLETVTEYRHALDALGKESKLDIVSKEHQAIAKLVEGFGGVYKPCGAGGGDVGVALIESRTRADILKGIITGAGFSVVPLNIDYDGLKVER